MMTLISLAIVVAFGTSLAGALGIFEIEVWWELASLITIMLLGHWLEMRAISQAQGALNALAALLPDSAERINDAEIQTVPLTELRVGDIVLVRPGARAPVDGLVIEGTADVDESMIAGGSKTVSKGPGATGYRRNSRQWRKPSSSDYSSRGTDSAVRHHEACCRCASLRVSRTSISGQSSRDCDIDIPWGSKRPAHQGQTRARTCPQLGHSDFR
jgi:magnesium-transporting ATPase (P-type)